MALYDVSDSAKKANPELVAGGTLYADLPIGSWVKNDMDSIPAGFLKAGDTITQSTYPELYALYGSEVPYKADTSELSEYEDITISSQSANPTEITDYDGFITFNSQIGSPNDFYIYKYISGSFVEIGKGIHSFGGSGTARGADAVTIPVVKGDKIYATGSWTSVKVRYYKKSLIIKAKMIGVPADFLAKVDEKITNEFSYKSANISCIFSGNSTISVDVTFNSPMSDTNYVVTFEGTFGNEQTLYPIVTSKTVNGFTVKVTKTDETTTGTYAIRYCAFRIPH